MNMATRKKRVKVVPEKIVGKKDPRKVLKERQELLAEMVTYFLF
jgi:hypothetical protein